MIRRLVAVLAVLGLAACESDNAPPVSRQLAVVLAGSGSGSVASAPAGISCTRSGGTNGGSCSATFDDDASVTLTATPTSGNTFEGWTGACAGSVGCTVTMDQARNVSATFSAPAQQLTVTLAGSGLGSVSSVPAGIACVASVVGQSGTCLTTFPAGAAVTLTATAASGHTFTGWSGACSGTNACVVTMDQARNAIATFTGPQQLTMTINGDGDGTVTSSPTGISCTRSAGVSSGTCVASFALGTQVTLNVATTDGSTFAGWAGACTGTAACVVTLDQARGVTATLSAPVRTLTLTPTGGGAGVVTSAPAGIACTWSAGLSTGTCSNAFANGALVTLTASPFAGSSFTGWTGACAGTGACVVTMTASKSVTATFGIALPPQQLTVTLAGAGNGSVTSTPAGISCARSAGTNTGTCAATFAGASQVTLTASATAPNTFSGWAGACTGAGACVVTMDAQQAVTGTFSSTSTGSISGTITDGETTLPVSGATVAVRSGAATDGPALASAVTGTSGTYQLGGLAPGTYTITAAAVGYTDGGLGNIVVGTVDLPNQNVALFAIHQATETRIQLMWNTTQDLDAHLTGPDNAGGRFHVFWFDFGDPAGPPFAYMNVDDDDGFGPEAISIVQQFAGVYRFSVHDFNNLSSTTSTALGSSGARVQVFRGNVLVSTFNVPVVAGTLWTVFELNGTVITPINTMTFHEDPGTILIRAPDIHSDADVIWGSVRPKPSRTAKGLGAIVPQAGLPQRGSPVPGVIF